ncbi:chemotaxis protein MotB [Acetoanaerobium pronyense]|uniref:Chemotaxis protein MotB n=1 Tax=Acetoanaerobium pronyense TaxID=1482736 RepID=A0ABS4KF66_9FIRM|nr:flagellar motor protein MotB [Acetoanaerobium pronyense]MBP2026405.1 chemotaxis protein MotB [Acetoanaerobium pronyense]
MGRKKKVEEKKGGVAEYMLTYGDMMTLLLCFFVLLFSFASIDAKKFEAVIQSFSGALGVLEGGRTVEDIPAIDTGLIDDGASSQVLEMQSFQNLERTIQEYLDQNNLSDSVTILNESAGLLLRFQDNILFDPGSADLKSDSAQIMIYIGNLLNGPDFENKFISIEGHTDNIPMNTPRFPSNWELSVGRASNVVRFLIENTNIDSERISAAGYSEYHPVVPNDSPENRARNRRVDIVILKDMYHRNTAPN